ncbi:hypothetical protein EJB05_43602 [Eragrostis curvula]|uniref:DNA2/NAM7 helicase-like C-terminal domain-containing protein n=1 Tax=Eragrostis curvula TaxID=38414 RepID=A0A5J9TFN6_9POAL|nr:hypothetical protein EJB05_43602 [Eragrostis curvula]
MARAAARRLELADRWRKIQEDEEAEDDGEPSEAKHSRLIRAKEECWIDLVFGHRNRLMYNGFSHSYNFLVNLPEEEHIWCGYADIMGPFLETFHGFFDDEDESSSLRIIWRRVSQELGICTQCVCEHHQGQEFFNTEYRSDTVDPLLKVLHLLDEERVTEHLTQINAKIQRKEYDPSCHGAEVVSIMFEVLMYPALLDDQSLANQFQMFIETIDESYEVSLSTNQQYPGAYALLFFKSCKARAIGLRLARSMGKLRRAVDLDPLQPLLQKYINFLETEVLPSTSEHPRPRVQLRRADIWLGFKSLLGFLEAPAFEDGILEKYPVFLSIVLNHVSDDRSDLSCAVSCLKASFEMLGKCAMIFCYLSCLQETYQPDTLIVSLEALQDGEHEKQRRNILYFLLHQVTRSSNFSALMRKNATKIALLIVQRGYTMSPPCPPSECAHMWGPSLISSIEDTSLHSSLRQPAFDLINIVIISDASALISYKQKYEHVPKSDVRNSIVFIDDDDELPFSHDAGEKNQSCWNDFSVLNKLTCRECNDWKCIPLLWYLTMVQLEPAKLPIAFSKAVFWALSHISVLEPELTRESLGPVNAWLSSHAREVSSTFTWQVPNGADDGGDGKDCINSLKVSQFCTLLLKMFKRLAIHVMTQIEQRGLQKQWSWEPMMAESLVLALVDHNDNTRQVGRAILEHVSQSKGLTSGLQFLCSSASSLFAVFLGLRYAVKMVETRSILTYFHSFHHLFFVICKLFKEVVAQKPSVAQPAKPSEGGFLRQSYSSVQISSPEHVVDITNWEKFCTLVSTTLWPFISTCLREGETLICDKQCQISCVRLLELIPLVYERFNTYCRTQSCCTMTIVPDITDISWLFHLVHWGKSSLVITRHWKQCMLSLVKELKSSYSNHQHYVEDLDDMISHDAVNIGELEERISNLKLALSKEAPVKATRRGSIDLPIFTEPVDYPSSISHALQERNTSRDSFLNIESTKPSHASDIQEIILLSDSEENTTSVDVSSEEVLSSVMDNDASIASGMLKDVKPPGKKILTDGHASLRPVSTDNSTNVASKGFAGMKKQGVLVNVNDNSLLPKTVKTSVTPASQPLRPNLSSAKEKNKSIFRDISDDEDDPLESRSSIVSSKGFGGLKKQGVPVNANNNSLLPKIVKTSATPVAQPVRPNLSSDKEKFKSIFRDISDDEDDPLDHALDNSRRPQLVSRKPSILVPKRQVVQLPLPAEKRLGSGSMITSSRRLQPPKLSSWFKNILEMDYFAIVGLSSSEIVKKSALKEIPVCFDSQAQYVEIFQPLVLEEFKAQMQNAYVETPPDDMICGCISILSVERVDEFIIVRGRPENSESIKFKGCIENDLILLTKDPLKTSGQQVHVLGKVERRENDKNKKLIFVIKFFLSNDNARLNKVKRLLVERSKWFLNRVMSMTPQIREFSALSSLNDIPVLPAILNPVSWAASYHDSGNVYLDKLSHPMLEVLKLSYNDSQLHAVSVAIGSTKNQTKFDLSLIQGPPDNSYKLPRNESMDRADFSKPRTKISQSAAVTRAWQDAALAKQLINQRESPRMTERLLKGRALVCAQSNAAVDELVSRLSEGLYGSDGKLYKPYIVRVGNAKTVHSNSMPFFIDTLVEQRLSDELKTNNDGNLSDAESSSSLRAKLEKVTDRIRYYESRRKLIEADKKENDSPVVPEGDEVDDVSDEALAGKLNFLYAQKRKVSAELASAHAREKKIADENKFLKHKVRKSILGEAEIIVTTLSGCGGDIYGICSENASSNKYGNFSEHALFDVVVIDEAAQALEPATLIPLQLLKSRGTKCIMVGDPKQLPATVMSGLASKFLYECSMFERLQRAGYPVIMLTKQYRMNPEISRFPSLHFYDNKLLDGAKVVEKSASFHDHYCLGPYKFFDVADGRENCGRNSATQSLCNEFEADAAVELLKLFRSRYSAEFASRKIGIITPYRSQLFLLRSRFTSSFGPEIVAEMEINTVDGFQGREVDILVLSTVRASISSGDRHQTGEARSIGFVADVRRMNVALTRARLSLWIVGNARTLQTNSHWGSLVQNAKERDLFISVKRPYGLIFEKVHPTSKDSHSTYRSCHTNHLKQKNNEKIAMTSSQRSDARLQKEQATRASRNVEKQGKSLPTEQSKSASRWDQKVPKVQESIVRSKEEESEKKNDDLRTAKHSLEQNTDENSVPRKQRAGKRSTFHNGNHLELSKSLVMDSQEGSSVRGQVESNQPMEQNVCKETNKTSFNQDSIQSSHVRIHNKDKKNASQNNGMGTKDLPKCDIGFKSAGKNDDASPPAHADLQKLIQKAKGARKFSEKPRSDNSNKVDISLRHGKDLVQANQEDGACLPTDADMRIVSKSKKVRKFSEKPRPGNSNQVNPSEKPRSDSSKQVNISLKHGKSLGQANQDDGACPPTDVDTKMVNKAKRVRKFSEKPRSGNSTEVDPSLSSQFAEASSHMPESKKSQTNNLASKKDLIAARKRQREDVESLLSSGFIPSKKPLMHPAKKKN